MSSTKSRREWMVLTNNRLAAGNHANADSNLMSRLTQMEDAGWTVFAVYAGAQCTDRVVVFRER